MKKIILALFLVGCSNSNVVPQTPSVPIESIETINNSPDFNFLHQDIITLYFPVL